MGQQSRASDSSGPRFRAVLFDFGGTLDADGEPAVAQFLRGYRAAGGHHTRADFEENFRESDRQLAADPAIRTAGFRHTVDAQSRVLAALVADSERVDPTTIAGTVCDAVVAIAKRNARILATLRARGIRTAVISNFTGNLELCLAELGLASVLDVTVDSAIVGIRKPDPEIFTLALDRLGVAPANALMVGDNPFADVRPAAALGISTCWLAPPSRSVPEGCTPTFRIASLSELLGCLDAQAPTHNPQPAACTG
jgi:putative hydrolase of the HAD superfamily